MRGRCSGRSAESRTLWAPEGAASSPADTPDPHLDASAKLASRAAGGLLHRPVGCERQLALAPGDEGAHSLEDGAGLRGCSIGHTTASLALLWHKHAGGCRQETAAARVVGAAVVCIIALHRQTQRISGHHSAHAPGPQVQQVDGGRSTTIALPPAICQRLKKSSMWSWVAGSRSLICQGQQQGNSSHTGGGCRASCVAHATKDRGCGCGGGGQEDARATRFAQYSTSTTRPCTHTPASGAHPGWPRPQPGA